jgi:GTP-binding protein EngB required for normal cell division
MSAAQDLPSAAGSGRSTVDVELAGRFQALGRFTRFAAAHVPPETAPALPAARALVERATTRLRLCAGPDGDHTVVAIAGATGVGKSSLFNSLAGMELSPAGHLRPTTGEAHACVWNARGADPLLDWLGVAPQHRFVRESPLDAEDQAALRGLVLLDLPDVDSIAGDNRIESDRLVGIVDLVIWVLDPQKYADQTVHEQYLRHMGALNHVTVVVFNKADRLTPADAASCRADLARLVEADGLPGVPVVSTSAVTGEGVGELRALLEKAVAGRPAAMARLEGELDAAVESVAPLVPVAAVESELVSRVAVPELAEGFAAATGLDAVAGEAATTHRRRAGLFRSPWRRAPALPEIPPAEPAAVGLAVRRLAVQTALGLPQPWPDLIRMAATTHLDRLPDDLSRALSAARGRPPGLAVWRFLRVLWWLSIAAAVVGIAWSAVTWRDEPRPWVPLVVGAAGLAVALVLPLVLVPIARRRARRYGRVVTARLHEAALTIAREVVTPVRQILRDYSEARAALAEAGAELSEAKQPR